MDDACRFWLLTALCSGAIGAWVVAAPGPAFSGGRKHSNIQEMTMTALDVQRLLGKAALTHWSSLPRDVQELLFDAAVPGEGPDRTAMATILHDQHPKTAHPPKPTALA